MAETRYFSPGRHSTLKENLIRGLPMALAPLGAAGLDSLITPGLSFFGGFGAGAPSVGSQALTAASTPAGYTSSAVAPAAGAGTGTGAAAGTGSTAAGGSGLTKYLDDIRAGVSNFANARGANRATDQYFDDRRDAGERDRAQLELQRIQSDLEQRRYLDESYNQNIGRATRGGLLRGVQDVNIQAPGGLPVGTVTGGLRPSAILGKEELGRTIQSRAMSELLNPRTMAGEGGSTGATSRPNLTAGMSRDDVSRAVSDYYASRGTSPQPTSVDYWTDKYFSPEIAGDYTYLGDRLAQADEFTGGPTGRRSLPAIPTIPKSSPARRSSGVDTGLGIASAALPFVSSLLGDYRSRAPQPAPIPLPGNQYGYRS